MDLTLTGKVIKILPEQSGQGRNGPWRKQEFILEVPGDFPKQVCLVQWGENIDKAAVNEGETVTAHIDIQSREYNGRWFTDVKAWRIERPRNQEPDHAPSPAGEPWPEYPPEEADGEDDLPF